MSLAPDENKIDDSEAAEVVEGSPQEPETIEKSQTEPESTPAGIPGEPNVGESEPTVDESSPTRDEKVEETLSSDPAPISDDVKEDDPTPSTESAEAPIDSGRSFHTVPTMKNTNTHHSVHDS
jgi:hypothetical protein